MSESLSPTTQHWQLYAAGLGPMVSGAVSLTRGHAPQIYPRNIVAASCGGLVAVARKIVTRMAGVTVAVRYELVALATLNREDKLNIIFDEDDDKEIQIVKVRTRKMKKLRKIRRRKKRKEGAS